MSTCFVFTSQCATTNYYCGIEAPVPLAQEHNPDKFGNQAEDSSSSSFTTENQRPENAFFDRSENINNDEGGLTEPTSICIEDAVGNIKETRMQKFNVVDKRSADEKAQLLSDLDVHYDPTKSSLRTLKMETKG